MDTLISRHHTGGMQADWNDLQDKSEQAEGFEPISTSQKRKAEYWWPT